MAIPSSGAISLTTVQTEFGGSNPISLSEYYAGGTYVPSGTTGTYGAVPSSGTISLRNFYGTSAVVISITNQTVSDVTGGARDALVGYRLTSTGLAQTQSGTGSFGTVETWCTPTGEAVNYEALVTVTSGTLTSGTSGSWIALSTTRTWTRDASIGLNELCVFTVEIRRTGTGTVLDTATITLEADASF